VANGKLTLPHPHQTQTSTQKQSIMSRECRVKVKLELAERRAEQVLKISSLEHELLLTRQ
jgi:hypothetical protein